MNITVESVLMIALVVYALYLLVNRCGCQEGMKDSGDPENSSDCERLCKERGVGLSQGQQCVYDKDCKYGGVGCKIGGVSLCRLCDNDESSDYLPCSPPSPPPHHRHHHHQHHHHQHHPHRPHHHKKFMATS